MQWLSDESVVFAAAAMYQEQVPSYKHLDEPLDMLDEGSGVAKGGPGRARARPIVATIKFFVVAIFSFPYC